MMKKSNPYKCLVVGVVICLLAGCAREAYPVAVETESIVCEAVALGNTKGLAETTTASVRTSGLGLFAWRTDAGRYFDAAEPYLENSSFVHTGEGIFRATPARYWPLGSWLSFFAYAPYHSNVGTGQPLEYPSSDYVPGDYPRLKYTPSDQVSSQEDLVLSAPVLDRASTEGTVPLNFTHVLCRIKLRARWTGTESQKEAIAEGSKSVRIISAQFRSILGSNCLTYGRKSYQWDAHTGLEMASLANAAYLLSTDNDCLASLALPLAPADYSDTWVNAPAGFLYLLPQALVPDAVLRVIYGIYDSGGDLEGDSVTVDYPIGTQPVYIWPAGHEVTYSITIDLSGAVPLDVDITFDCNAGTFTSAAGLDFDASNAGSFLGGDFILDASSSGGFGPDGPSIGGSSAGTFTL